MPEMHLTHEEFRRAQEKFRDRSRPIEDENGRQMLLLDPVDLKDLDEFRASKNAELATR
jgi:hypothetical protein